LLTLRALCCLSAHSAPLLEHRCWDSKHNVLTCLKLLISCCASSACLFSVFVNSGA
jgi:hypothetical protein